MSQSGEHSALSLLNGLRGSQTHQQHTITFARQKYNFSGASLLPSPVSARGRVSYPEPASTGSGLWVLQTGKETEPRVFFHPQHLRDSALSLREQGICAVWPGLLQDQWWPQGGRLCTPFFGEQKLASRAPSEQCLGYSLNTGGRKGFPSCRCCNDTTPRCLCVWESLVGRGSTARGQGSGHSSPGRLRVLA